MRKLAITISFLACLLVPTSFVKGTETQLQIVVNGAGSESSPNHYVICVPSADEGSKTVTVTGDGTVDPPQDKTCSKCDGPNLVTTNPTETTEDDKTYFFTKPSIVGVNQDGKTVTFTISPSTPTGEYHFQLTKIKQVFRCPSDYTGDPVTQGNALVSDEKIVTVVKIEIKAASDPFIVWYFNDITPGNYPVSADIVATMTPALDSSFTWTVSKGTGIFDLSASIFNSQNATVSSLAKSTSLNDCQIKATSKQFPICSGTFSFTVDYLISCTPKGQPVYQPLGPIFGVMGYQTLIPYTVNSRFGTPAVKDLEINENWSNAINYGGAQWGLPSPGNGSITPATLRDLITPPFASTPTPTPPQTPLSTQRVQDWNGVWMFGSHSYGSGITVLQKKWVRFIDHGEHQ
ncbi:MAG: hypothetical protein PHV34_06345 [Verrucomicrobiae bacterium]|nr:hypothetical protein [Verrucomicrobiae bacterium]